MDYCFVPLLVRLLDELVLTMNYIEREIQLGIFVLEGRVIVEIIYNNIWALNSRTRLSELLSLEDFPASNHTTMDLLGNRKIICYGAGNGYITFSIFVVKPNNLTISTIIDRKFSAPDVSEGVLKCSPKDYMPSEEEKKESVVVITVGKTEFRKEILEYLHSLGFERIIFAWEIYEYLQHGSSQELISKGYSLFHEERSNILKCFDLLVDVDSKDVFCRVLFTHLLRRLIAIPSRPLVEQYFPQDIKFRKGYSRFINCGSYDGDTIRSLNTYCGTIDALICFEPDNDNFQALSQYLKSYSERIAKNIISIPCGVYDKEAKIRFESNEMDSSISDTGNSFIQCVALDDIFPNFDPTFISMDVEGVELEALKGAEQLIKKNKPDLAIAIYHTPKHSWEIPLWIHGLDSGYKMYMRNYTGYVYETVLYATTSD